MEIIAIGNGTASRESEAFVADLLKDFPDVSYVIVNESGASVYSASELARYEFPDLPVEKRSAISIARRLQDLWLSWSKLIPSLSVSASTSTMSTRSLCLKVWILWSIRWSIRSVSMSIRPVLPFWLTLLVLTRPFRRTSSSTARKMVL